MEVKISNTTDNVVLARWTEPVSSPGPNNHLNGPTGALLRRRCALAPSDVVGMVGVLEQDFPEVVASQVSPSLRLTYIIDKTSNEDMEDLR